MAHHDPKACNKVPYTAYYSNGNWSCKFRCPECGSIGRQVVGAHSGYEMMCDGEIMGAVKLDIPIADWINL